MPREIPDVGLVGFGGGFKPAIAFALAKPTAQALEDEDGGGGDPDDGGNDCLDVSTLEAMFSGVGSGCPSCEYWNVAQVTGVSNLLSGTFSLNQTAPGSTTWSLVIASGFTYRLYGTADTSCAGGSSGPFTKDVEVVATCVGGKYNILAKALNVNGQEVEIFGGGSGVTIAPTASAALGAAMTNTRPCGGTATLSP